MDKVNNFKISNSNKSFFKNEGYLVLKNFFDPKMILDLNNVLFENFKFFQKKNIKKKDFNKHLIELRKNSKDTQNRLYHSQW